MNAQEIKAELAKKENVLTQEGVVSIITEHFKATRGYRHEATYEKKAREALQEQLDIIFGDKVNGKEILCFDHTNMYNWNKEEGKYETTLYFCALVEYKAPVKIAGRSVETGRFEMWIK